MIPDTTTVTPKFITEQPDWSKPVNVTFDFNTSVAEATGQGRQRARWRQQPKYAIAYTVAALTVSEFSVRRSAIIGELAAPLVCPIWTDEFVLLAMASANVADLGETLTRKKFKVGSYACFMQTGLATTFRKIVSISGTTVTFEAASVPSFTAGATVYPCIVGERAKSGTGFNLNKIDDTDELISVEEL